MQGGLEEWGGWKHIRGLEVREKSHTSFLPRVEQPEGQEVAYARYIAQAA